MGVTGWLVLFAVLAVMLVVPGIGWTVWFRHPRPRPWTLLAVALATTAPLATGWVGVVVALIQVRSFRGGEDIEPSQKAQVLAETISEAMNMTTFAVIGATVVSIAV